MPTLRKGKCSVAVVMATHGRAQMLERALDAIAAQTRPPDQIVVVDDDSTDSTPQVLGARPGVTALRVSRRGPGRARQAALVAVETDVVAFTDDDCIPTPLWLEKLVAPIEAGDADAVQGPTVMHPDQIDRLRDPWHRTQRVGQYNERFPTSNMAYRTDVLTELGGFAEQFTGPGCAGEDTDLGWRCLESGRRILFAPEAIVHHEVWPGSFRQALRDAGRRAMVVLVVKHHPAIRRLAYRRLFYKRSHARALAAIGCLGALTIVRRWLPLAGIAGVMLAYVVHTRGDGRSPAHRAMLIAQVLIVDTVEVAAFARASLRYRTFYL
ncbi:MAG TPA: glycosyltransferase family 2 protein [Acidimicrobiales bacterium]|nr:glycosyltransferase family 2 protein [Acidimicrobiales bacterium]